MKQMLVRISEYRLALSRASTYTVKMENSKKTMPPDQYFLESI